MIDIKAVYEKDKLVHLTIDGHGGLEYSKDVICAGVSSCYVGALNALNNAENYKIIVEEGHGEVTRIHATNKHDEVVLETLMVQLETIRQAFPNRLKIQISGKEGNK